MEEFLLIREPSSPKRAAQSIFLVCSQALEDSCRHHISICVAWLHLTNAFGSVPHSTLLEMLTSVGIPCDIMEIA